MSSDKMKATVGVFAGILRVSGDSTKILLRRRIEEGSIIPDQSFKGNWELPGGGVMEQDSPVPYNYLQQELAREVFEETGLEFSLHTAASPFFPFPFKGPNGYDLALVTPVLLTKALEPRLDEMKFRWTTIDELNQLARHYVPAKRDPLTEGKGLLSGWGKRMHCMALSSFSAEIVPAAISQQALDTLNDIQKT